MIDFTEYMQNHPSFRAYGGANGIKKGIIFRNEPYMLKIEHRNKKNKYINSILSEYISSKIFSMLNIETQEVILGKVVDNNKEKLCVACKDFKKPGEYLYEFLSIKNSVLTENSSNGSGMELDEILDAINRQKFFPANKVKKHFWEMFIVDAYLGNFDRHNGNWGILVNEITHSARLAPVFDCGSCLYPAATDENLKYFLETPDELNKRIYEFPRTAIRVNGEKQLYHEFLLTTENKECLNAIAKIVPIINKKSFNIKSFIKIIPILTSTRKNFYNKILAMRRELILLPALERANKLLNIKEQTLSR